MLVKLRALICTLRWLGSESSRWRKLFRCLWIDQNNFYNSGDAFVGTTAANLNEVNFIWKDK